MNYAKIEVATIEFPKIWRLISSKTFQRGQQTSVIAAKVMSPCWLLLAWWSPALLPVHRRRCQLDCLVQIFCWAIAVTSGWARRKRRSGPRCEGQTTERCYWHQEWCECIERWWATGWSRTRPNRCELQRSHCKGCLDAPLSAWCTGWARNTADAWSWRWNFDHRE